MRLYALDELVAGVDVDPGIAVVERRASVSGLHVALKVSRAAVAALAGTVAAGGPGKPDNLR